MIQQLIEFEKTMLKKYEDRGYESDTQFKNDIIKFLEDLETQEKNIKTNKEFAWVLAAISRWTHYLSMRFDVFLTIKSPDLRDLPDLQKDEDVIEERKDVHEPGGKTLEDLAKSVVETLHHGFDQLMMTVSERQRRTKEEGYRTYTDLGETISQKVDYIGDQLKKHHYEMSSQHEEQTSKILDEFGKPYSGKETPTKIASTDYFKLVQETSTKLASTGYPKLADTA